jgi:hypothetical protein
MKRSVSVFVIACMSITAVMAFHGPLLADGNDNSGFKTGITIAGGLLAAGVIGLISVAAVENSRDKVRQGAKERAAEQKAVESNLNQPKKSEDDPEN